MSTERKRSVSMQRWSREAGSWVDDMGVLRIDVDAHADWPLARLARSLLPVIPAKAGTQCLRCFEEQSRWVPAFAGMTALPDGHDRRESRPWPLPLGAGVIRCRRAPRRRFPAPLRGSPAGGRGFRKIGRAQSELQSLMRISYAVFCLTKKNTQ